ncbi:hypothetical protein, partial [Plantibacter sp. CFBP 13570]|uniref:hypothetical protein n=1 Tax=Plantibacter sp. CFBP 13570 TaxID=2775272 RepID=UPI001930D697
ERVLDARRGVALAALAPTTEAAWWSTATPKAVADSYETAQAWAPFAPEAASARDRIGDQIRLRYGLDPAEAGPNTPEILRATAAAAADRGEAAKLRAQAESEATAAQLLLVESASLEELSRDTYRHADDLERGVDWEAGDERSVEAFTAAEDARLRGEDYQQQADTRVAAAADHYEASGTFRERADALDARADQGTEYARGLQQEPVPHDSAERRQQLANSISADVPEPVRRARLIADRDQATHPNAAVNATPGRAPRASKARSGAGQERTRSERSR